MSLDVRINLVVGVPLLSLGTIECEEKEMQLVDALGKSTGRKMMLRHDYFVALNGNRCLIASNEKSIADGWDGEVMTYFYDSLVENHWLHQSCYDGGPAQVVIGLLPDGSDVGQHDSFEATTLPHVHKAAVEVSWYLKKEFGYAGDVYVIAQASYSY